MSWHGTNARISYWINYEIVSDNTLFLFSIEVEVVSVMNVKSRITELSEILTKWRQKKKIRIF